VASRFVANLLEGNSEVFTSSGFKGCGMGVMLADEYPQMADGRILTGEPKDHWIHVLLLAVF
jgi:hypothetical protein